MKTAGFWLTLSMLSAYLLFAVFFKGVFAAGKDIDETCALAGQLNDHAYRG